MNVEIRAIEQEIEVTAASLQKRTQQLDAQRNSFASGGCGRPCGIELLPRQSGQRVGQAELDECLPGDADSSRFEIDRAKKVHGKIDVDSLHASAWARSLLEIEIKTHVLPAVMERVELGCCPSSRCHRLLSPPRVLGARR